MRKVFIPLLLGCVGLSACADPPMEYWRRVSAPSTSYLTGDQAQVLLEKDISQCACGTDQLRNIITDDDQAMAYQQAALGKPQSGDPREFRSCMQARGWQRVDPYFAPGQTEERLNHYQTIPGHPLCTL